MRKLFLLIMLIISSLTLAESLSVKKKRVEKEHIVLTGRMVFKQKEFTPIKFYLEDKLRGNYSLTLFQENQENADFLIEKGSIINTILKLRIWSKLGSCQFKNEKNVNYLLIPFSNEELADMNHLEILFLGFKTISEIEKNSNCDIYPSLK